MNFIHLIKNIEHFAIYFAILLLTACNNQSKNNDLSYDRIDTPTTLSTTDTKFVLDATELSLEGIDMGKLAQTNSDNQTIKEIGRELVVDYRKVLNQLKVIAIHKTISLPDEMNSTGRDAYEKIMTKKGTEFDVQFKSIIITADSSTIHLFEQEAQYAQDTEVKECAVSSLQILNSNFLYIRTYTDTLHKAAVQ